MALPTTISSTWTTVTGGCRFGPFLSSAGNVYILLKITASISPSWAMYKATDPTSSFSEVDSAHRPANGGANDVTGISAVQDGDTLHIVMANNDGALNKASYRYDTFDMSTDLWGVVDEAIHTGLTVSDTTAGVNGGLQNCDIVVRSDGTIVVGYNGAGEVFMGGTRGRMVYARRSTGGTWTTGIAVGPTGTTDYYRAGCSELGASDRTHFVYTNSSQSDVVHRSLDSSNTLDTAATIDATGLTSTGQLVAKGVHYVSGSSTLLRVPYVDSSGKISVAKFTSGANPSFTIDVDAATNAVRFAQYGSTPSWWALAYLILDGFTLYLAYVDSTNFDLYTDVNSNDLGWGTDVLRLSATMNSLSASFYNRPGAGAVIGYVYDDGGTVKYNEVNLIYPWPRMNVQPTFDPFLISGL